MERRLIDARAVHAHGRRDARMELFQHDRAHHAEEQDDARDLESRRRRADAAAREHEEKQDALGKARPKLVVGGDEACRRERRRLKEREAQSVGHVVKPSVEKIRRDEQHRAADDAEIRLELGVAPQHLWPFLVNPVVKPEAAARDEHEERHPKLDGGTLEVRGARVVGGEAARADRRHRVIDGVERVHAAEEEGEERRARQDDVDAKEHGGQVLEARQDALRPLGARLGVVHGDRALPGGWQERDEDDDDAEAAEPMREASPEKHALRHGFDVFDDGGARAREARDAFEDAVEVAEIAAQKVRQHAEEGRQEPADARDGDALAKRQALARRLAEAAKCRARRRAQS